MTVTMILHPSKSINLLIYTNCKHIILKLVKKKAIQFLYTYIFLINAFHFIQIN